MRKNFNLYIQGSGVHKIKQYLDEYGIKTVTGKAEWSTSTIDQMLSNEKYVGDVRMQKTYTADFLTGRREKNDGQVETYLVENAHRPIIKKKTFELVQKLKGHMKEWEISLMQESILLKCKLELSCIIFYNSFQLILCRPSCHIVYFHAVFTWIWKLGGNKMAPKNNRVFYLPYDDYAQSANTLFHFMKEPEYLNAILLRRAIVPRYCVETIDYLNIHKDTLAFNEAAILQKCFCDIPFHKLADTFAVNGVGEVYDSLSKDERAELEKNNTHCAYYGEYAVAFSKSWGEQKNLQPVHYLNKDSQYAKDFSALFERIFRDDDLPDEYSQDVINRLVYVKPLRGIMQRRITRSDSSPAIVEIYKNFHDEREWRYVPSADVLSSLKTESIIANPYVIPFANEISKGLENERYKALWLDFSYDDIRYIIVPDILARIDTIRTITDLPDSCFEDQDNISMQKNVLISKILVLEEIRKDW